LPAPRGLELDDVERLLLEVASGARLAGMGFTGLAPPPGDPRPVRRRAPDGPAPRCPRCPPPGTSTSRSSTQVRPVRP
jgi:hypothetical protein